MISKLPPWVWLCAWILAFVAGMVNIVGLFGFQHQAITHLTGNTSMLAGALAALDGPAILRFAATIGSFMAGTALSGFIIQDSTLKLGRRYGVALFLEAVFLCLAVPLLNHRETCAASYAAALRVRTSKCDGEHLQRDSCAHNACFRNVHRPRYFSWSRVARLAGRCQAPAPVHIGHLRFSLRRYCRRSGISADWLLNAFYSRRIDGDRFARLRFLPDASRATGLT